MCNTNTKCLACGSRKQQVVPCIITKKGSKCTNTLPATRIKYCGCGGFMKHAWYMIKQPMHNNHFKHYFGRR